MTALDLPDAALRANVIETLGILAREVPTEMNGSVDGIVTKLLKGITSQESTNTIGAVVSLMRSTCNSD